MTRATPSLRSSPQRTINAPAMREDDVQCAVVRHLQVRGVPGIVFAHPANGGSRHPVEAVKFAGLGVRAGMPDLLIWHGGQSYGLELKTQTGVVSSVQTRVHADMRLAGVDVAVAHGLDAALAQLERWGLLR